MEVSGTIVGSGNLGPGGYVSQTPTQEREAEVSTAVAPSAAALSAADRCDRCGAQAYLRVELPSGGELHFCAHHAREHGDKLREIAAVVHDETHRLGERRPATDSRA